MFIFRIIFSVVAGYLALILILGVVYIAIPPVSTLMLARWAHLNSFTYKPVPLKSINRNLLRAVITAEDDTFCTHSGINWQSMDKAIKNKNKKRAKGASTISMQVAKNLFLWPERSYLRKMLEIPIAMYIDFIWPKARMMEIYLSIAQWGDGVFGAEAAAKKYFNKHASQLTLEEASLLAAALPNPIKRHPNKPSSYMRGYAGSISARSGGADLSCF